MPWCGPTPERPFPSLGWGVLAWTFAFLPSPADENKPLIYTDEQARRIVRWYEIDPDTGEFPWRRLILEEAKGWGKSPFGGSLELAEFRGPVCFDGWDANGQPVGVPWGTGDRPPPWVQVAAVSEDQTENTYGALYAMLIANDHRAARELRIDDGRTRLYLRDVPGAKLEPVTASAGSREGQRTTHGLADETHLWTPRNGGVRLIRTMRRNVAKMGGRMIETTNAPVLGEKSVAEQSDPDAPEAGVLHYARRARVEPDPNWTDAQLEELLVEVYGEAWWVDPKRLVRETRDPANLWDDALRFWFNLRTSGTGRAVDPRLWDALASPRDVPDGTAIGLGFDGSVSRDATFLRGCTADGYGFIVGHWQRPPGASPEWTVDRTDVNERMAWAFEHYTVGRMLFDPPFWRTEGEAWARQFGEDIVVALDTNQPRRFAPAVDRWLTALREGTHTHDGDPLTGEHVKAAHLRKVAAAQDEADGRTKFVLVKGDDRRRIDGAVADVLAYEAAMTMPAVGSQEAFFAWA
jgi:hypothetical protein